MARSLDHPELTVDASPRQATGRASRIDKGTVQLTARDIRALRWIGEQYVVRFDTIQQLLGREPKNLNRFAPVDGVLSERNTRKTIRRWMDEGLADYRKFLVADRGYVWLGYKGMRTAGLLYKTYIPTIPSLHHFHRINELRINLEGRYQGRIAWTCERELRRLYELLPKEEKSTRHLPDAVLTLDGRQEIAIEVEITKKSDKRLLETIERLAQQYKGVWYFVPDDVRAAVVKAIGSRTQIFRVYNLAEIITSPPHD